MKPPISGLTRVAGVAGAPVAHSLSPLIHNAWLEAADIDGVYVAFTPPADGFTAFAKGLRRRRGARPQRHRAVQGRSAGAGRLAPAIAARRAGAANLLIFEPDGQIRADNTDGAGLLAALAEQAPGFDARRGPVVILGAGGAARGAAAALLDAGAPQVRLVNRTHARAEARAARAGRGRAGRSYRSVGAFDGRRADRQRHDARPRRRPGAGRRRSTGPCQAAVVVDMVYRPLRTEFLERAAAAGRTTVDGLAMLIGQARAVVRGAVRRAAARYRRARPLPRRAGRNGEP